MDPKGYILTPQKEDSQRHAMIKQTQIFQFLVTAKEMTRGRGIKGIYVPFDIGRFPILIRGCETN